MTKLIRNNMSKQTAKEEPKFVTVNIESATGEDLGKVSYIPLPNLDSIFKQETLEEVAERLYPEEWNWREREIFIAGARWQQESQTIVLH